MRKVALVNKQIYHIFNRGTDKRKIFLTKNDYERFLINMKIFNDSDVRQHHLGRFDTERPELNKKSAHPLVDILCFCLMPNHYHLLLLQREENGISKYLHKLQMGYSKYFNMLYERSGNLFQGAYKVVEVNKDSQFQYVPLYIHMNPLDLIENGWKEKGIRNVKRDLEFLEKYRWSSLKDYISDSPVPYLETKIISSLYSSEDWREEIRDFLTSSNVRHRVSDAVADISYV